MKIFENDADWEERAWELAKKLVSIDSSDPGAYEGEIGERLYEYLSRCCERCAVLWQTRSKSHGRRYFRAGLM